MNLIKIILIVLGTLSLCVGIIGIIVPGLPTTPFILLTAGLFIRSSDRLYHKLVSNTFIGFYVREFRKNKGMTKKAKRSAIGIMWVMIAISCVFLIETFTVRLIVLIIGAIGTFVMGYIIPTIIIQNQGKQ